MTLGWTYCAPARHRTSATTHQALRLFQQQSVVAATRQSASLAVAVVEDLRVFRQAWS